MDIISKLKEIHITEVDDFKIGNAQDKDGGTGCTAILFEKGAVCGVDVRGGGPATKETDRLDPKCRLDISHGIMFSGGSAFGLEASSGAMAFLEKKGIGYDTGFGKVPLISAASIFDLPVGKGNVKPDKSMGYKACENAYDKKFLQGNQGAGTGATVGKFLGPDRMMKSGIGSYAVEIGDLKIGAIVVVNSLGDVYDMQTGEYLAGLLNKEKTTIMGTEEIIGDMINKENDFFNKNTTIGCIITNGLLTNAQATKLSSISQNGLARVIWPVHTSADGDTVFTMATGRVTADTDIMGAIASEVMAKAINNAVQQSESSYGYISYKELENRTKK